jgi:hypothetical protein
MFDSSVKHNERNPQQNAENRNDGLTGDQVANVVRDEKQDGMHGKRLHVMV